MHLCFKIWYHFAGLLSVMRGKNVVHYQEGSTYTAGHIINICLRDETKCGVWLLELHTGSCSSLVKIFNQWWTQCSKIVNSYWKLALPHSVFRLPVSVVVSVEINRMFYFWNVSHSIYLFWHPPLLRKLATGLYSTPYIHSVAHLVHVNAHTLQNFVGFVKKFLENFWD